MATLGRWLREPLLHFVVLGTALFTLHRWIAPTPAHRIEMSDTVLDGLRQDHLRRTGALPTAVEEAALLRRYVDDEILYREALAQGLDRGDVIVRRRLVQKMEFVLENSEPLDPPTDAVLQEYVDRNERRYATPGHISFTHVFVSTDRHGSGADALAASLRDQLTAGANPASLGDPFLHGAVFAARTESDLGALFGTEFVRQLMAVPGQTWSAPLRSSYGLHIVRVEDRRPAAPPRLDAVRDRALLDWQTEQRDAARRAGMAHLRQQYDVRTEGDATRVAWEGATPAP